MASVNWGVLWWVVQNLCISKTWGDLLSVGKDDKLILLPFEFILLASLIRGCFAVATGGNWHEWNIDHWLFTWSWDYNKYFHFTNRRKTSNLSSCQPLIEHLKPSQEEIKCLICLSPSRTSCLAILQRRSIFSGTFVPFSHVVHGRMFHASSSLPHLPRKWRK